MKKKTVIPVAVGSFDAISTDVEKYVVAIEVIFKAEHAPKTALLGAAEISRLDAKTQKNTKASQVSLCQTM